MHYCIRQEKDRRQKRGLFLGTTNACPELNFRWALYPLCFDDPCDLQPVARVQAARKTCIENIRNAVPDAVYHELQSQ